MLSHLEQHIVAALAPAHLATLATHGPAGLQAHVFRCLAYGTRIYLLLPRTSDHLVNLESDSTAVVTTLAWQLRGRGRIVSSVEAQRVPELIEAADAPWSVVVEVTPGTVQLAHAQGWGAAETFDLD